MKPFANQRLAGGQIELADIAPAHFERVVAWRNDPENQKYFFTRHTFTVEGQWQWYRRYQDDPTDYTFVIELKDGTPVGTVAIYHVDFAKGEGEFGRLLIGDPAGRGCGAGREACRLCLAFAADVLGLRRVYLEVYRWNNKAISLYRGLGFTESGTRTECAPPAEVAEVVQMEIHLPAAAAGAPRP